MLTFPASCYGKYEARELEGAYGGDWACKSFIIVTSKF